MTSTLDSIFSDEDLPSPRQTRTSSRTPNNSLPWWAARPPRVIPIAGVPTPCFGTGSMARAVGRTSFTTRRWEREGLLPPVPFRDINGPVSRHRRFWPEEVLDRIAVLAEEHGLWDGALPNEEMYAEVAALYVEAVRAAVTRATAAAAEGAAG